MKKLPAIPDDILQEHERTYFDSIKTVLDLLSKGLNFAFRGKYSATIKYHFQSSSGIAQYFKHVRDLFVSCRLLTASAEKLRDTVLNWQPPPIDSSECVHVSELYQKIFNYSAFRQGKKLVHKNGVFYWETNATGWGGYEFLQYHSRTVKYCPYCNADTVYAFEKGNHKKVASALDHFYPQSKYPFLALSLYNLVPVCSRCNSQMKGDADMTKVANPYIEDMHQNVCFFPILPNASPSLDDPCHIAVLPRKKAYDPRAKEFVRLFELERLYSSAFARDALLCMERVRLYTPEFKRFMASFIGAKDPRIVDVLLFGAPPDESKINQTRLGKMVLDIVERFSGFC